MRIAKGIRMRNMNRLPCPSTLLQPSIRHEIELAETNCRTDNPIDLSLFKLLRPLRNCLRGDAEPARESTHGIEQ